MPDSSKTPVRKFRVINLGDEDLGASEFIDPTVGGTMEHNGDQYLVLAIDDQARLIRVAEVDSKKAHDIYLAMMDIIVRQFSGGDYRIRDAIAALLHLAAMLSEQHKPSNKSECAEAFMQMAHAHCVTTFGLAATVRAVSEINRRTAAEGLYVVGDAPSA